MFATLIIICALLTIAAFFLGRNFPDWKKEEEIFEKILIERYKDRIWECVEVIDLPCGGPFGSSLRQILLERQKERILLCSSDTNIQKGVTVKLVPRTPQQLYYPYNSTIDRLMSPEVLNRHETR